jgi:hypothetical protein
MIRDHFPVPTPANDHQEPPTEDNFEDGSTYVDEDDAFWLRQSA